MSKLTKSGDSIHPSKALLCATCGQDMLSGPRHQGIWLRTDTVFHCEGISKAYGAILLDEPHHQLHGHPNCWKCGANLGCSRCSGTIADLICMHGSGRRSDGELYGHDGLGPVVASRAAFVASGPIAGQRHDAYPHEWVMQYYARHQDDTAQSWLSPDGGGDRARRAAYARLGRSTDALLRKMATR